MDHALQPAAVFEEGGPLAASHPRYERRQPQIRMAEAVGAVFESGGRLVVEAGTGTGKTLAYLVPALLSGRKIVVSTATRALQDQLFHRDIPFLQEVLSDRLEAPLRAACLKGRSNYLCLHRLAEQEATSSLLQEEREVLARITSWARRTTTGDVAEMENLPEGLDLWGRIDARSETCLGRDCPEWDDCWLVAAREKAREARIIVVNHHLLLADLAVRHGFGELLPDYDVLVVDEAHRLADTATYCFGATLSNRRLARLAGDALRLAANPDEPQPALNAAGRTLREAGEAFFSGLPSGPGRQAVDRAALRTEALGRLLEGLVALAAAAEGARLPREEGAALARRAETFAMELEGSLEPSEETVTWTEARGSYRAVVCAPVEVGDLLAEHLFDPLHAAVVTSATLAVGGNLGWVRSRAGLEEAEELVLPSPFDHRRQALLYVPEDLPPPNAEEFLEEACERMAELVRASRGRAFLLFTSHANLRGAARRLRGRVGDHPLLVQGDAQKGALLEEFRGRGDAVLLATASFWEGVDVPGEALSLVVIDKLPFAYPGDPLVAARIEAIRKADGRPFWDYQVPEAILSLKQGLGRLLRSREDRGVLAVLDVRLREKSYGRLFFDSLPDFERTRELADVFDFFDA